MARLPIELLALAPALVALCAAVAALLGDEPSKLTYLLPFAVNR